MVEFALRRVLDVADWVSVTSGMAPDEIEYVIQAPRGDEIERSDSLVVLTKLYGCAYRKTSSKEYPAPETYAVVEKGDRIEIGRWDMDKPIVTTYEELRESLEELLADVFAELDANSGADERREAIAYMNDHSGLDFRELYERLTGKQA